MQHTTSISRSDPEHDDLPIYYIFVVPDSFVPGEVIAASFSYSTYDYFVVAFPVPYFCRNSRRHIHLRLTMEVARSAPLAHDVGMQIEIPSGADDDVFIPYDVGDIQHDMESTNILITVLDLESALPVDKIDMHAVGETTINQSVMESQLTMQPDLYQMTDSQLFLTQQSDNETPQSVAPMTDSLVFLMHQSDNETPQPASIGNIGGDMVDSDDELLAHVDTLVQESRAPMYEVVEESTAPPLLAQKLNEVTEQNKVVEDTTVATAVAQKDDEVVEETTVTPSLVLTRHKELLQLLHLICDDHHVYKPQIVKAHHLLKVLQRLHGGESNNNCVAEVIPEHLHVVGPQHHHAGEVVESIKLQQTL